MYFEHVVHLVNNNLTPTPSLSIPPHTDFNVSSKCLSPAYKKKRKKISPRTCYTQYQHHFSRLSVHIRILCVLTRTLYAIINSHLRKKRTLSGKRGNTLSTAGLVQYKGVKKNSVYIEQSTIDR